MGLDIPHQCGETGCPIGIPLLMYGVDYQLGESRNASMFLDWLVK
jgi:hypothetical protein